MAERYNERDDRNRDRDRPWRDTGEYAGRGEHRTRSRDRDWDRGHWTRRDYEGGDDRGFMDRAGDEVRSWFGDEEAARRRDVDEHREGREHDRGWNRDDRGWSRDEERWRQVPERERYRISDAWDQRKYSARMTGTSAGPGAERTRTGPHAGKGPRGYQRSDDRICEEICELLTRDANVDATAVEVTVVTGEVTLRGNVDSRYEKRATEDIAESVQGGTAGAQRAAGEQRQPERHRRDIIGDAEGDEVTESRGAGA